MRKKRRGAWRSLGGRERIEGAQSVATRSHTEAVAAKTKTINELRAARGIPPIEGAMAKDAIARKVLNESGLIVASDVVEATKGGALHIDHPACECRRSQGVAAS